MTTYSGTNEFEGANFVKASLKGATLRFSDVEEWAHLRYIRRDLARLRRAGSDKDRDRGGSRAPSA